MTDMEWVMEYESVKQRIVCRLCGMENNRQYLSEHVYMPVEDMAVIYHIRLFSSEEQGPISIPVTHEMFKRYGIEKKELYQVAMSNTARLFPAKVESLTEALGVWGFMRKWMGPEFYIVTNDQGFYGAVHILNQEVMDMAAKRAGGDYYVLPSSVHEVLVLPKTVRITPSELEEIVRSVNATMLPKDVLSERVYEADLENHQLRRCERKEKSQDMEKEADNPEKGNLRNRLTRKCAEEKGPKL